MPVNFEIIPYGDSAYLVKFDVATYAEKVTDHIHALIDELGDKQIWEEVVPGYNSLLVYFCPAKHPPKKALSDLRRALNKTRNISRRRGRVVDIPVCYGGDFGPDMEVIEKSSGLSPEEIVQKHSKRLYKVCMMGFIPGFTFLSPAPKILHHDRRETPRSIVPAGSVGIAGWQTGIYGLESPGGWQIIGRTPLKIFDGLREDPFLLSAGDRVRFKPVGPDVFMDIDS